MINISKIYIIEIDESDAYDDYIRIYDKCFNTYESAKKHLLEHFECHSVNDGRDFFVLKDDHHYNSEFSCDATATIEELDLIKL